MKFVTLSLKSRRTDDTGVTIKVVPTIVKLKFIVGARLLDEEDGVEVHVSKQSGMGNFRVTESLYQVLEILNSKPSKKSKK